MKVRNRNYSVPFARPVAEKEKTISSDFLSTRRNRLFLRMNCPLLFCYSPTSTGAQLDLLFGLNKKQTVDVSHHRIGGV